MYIIQYVVIECSIVANAILYEVNNVTVDRHSISIICSTQKGDVHLHT